MLPKRISYTILRESHYRVHTRESSGHLYRIMKSKWGKKANWRKRVNFWGGQTELWNMPVFGRRWLGELWPLAPEEEESVIGKRDEFTFVELKVSVGCQLEIPKECLDIKHSLRKKVWFHNVQQKASENFKCKFSGCCCLVAMFDSFATSWIVTHQAPLSMRFPR